MIYAKIIIIIYKFCLIKTTQILFGFLFACLIYYLVFQSVIYVSRVEFMLMFMFMFAN